MNLIRELLDNEQIAKDFENVQSTQEMQVISLLLLRNNLQMIRNDVKEIAGWVKLFGLVFVIGLMLSLIF
jgi:hypothetical protein